MILPCDCKSTFQDHEHGQSNRVCNETASGARCTVCGKEKAGLKCSAQSIRKILREAKR